MFQTTERKDRHCSFFKPVAKIQHSFPSKATSFSHCKTKQVEHHMSSSYSPLSGAARDFQVVDRGDGVYTLKDVKGKSQVRFFPPTWANIDGSTYNDNYEYYNKLLPSEFQPTSESRGVLPNVVHLQTASTDSYLNVVPPIRVSADQDWTLVMAGATLNSYGANVTQTTENSIFLGPANTCNCQIELSSNALSVQTTNPQSTPKSLMYQDNIDLPFSPSSFHVLTLTHQANTATLQIYQDAFLVGTTSITANAWAEFSYIGSWFKGKKQSRLAVHRLAVLKRYVEPVDVQGVVRQVTPAELQSSTGNKPATPGAMPVPVPAPVPATPGTVPAPTGPPTLAPMAGGSAAPHTPGRAIPAVSEQGTQSSAAYSNHHAMLLLVAYLILMVWGKKF